MPLIAETWLDEQTVNTTTTGAQIDADVVQLANGNILVVWTSNDNTGAGSPAGLDVIGRIFLPDGTPLTAEFQVNLNFFLDDEQDMSIAALPGGGFIVTYEDTDATSTSIRLQEFDDAGVGVSAGITVVSDGASTDPNYRNSDIAVSSATSVLITYEEVSGGVPNIRGVIYDPTTNTYGSQISLIAFAGGNSDAHIAVLTNGNYVIAARNSSTDPYIGYRIISSTGANVLGAQEVSNTNTNAFSDSEPTITALTGGGFVIAWTNIDASDTDVQFRVYNAAGTDIGGGAVDFFGSSTNSNNEAVVVGLADGTFVIYYDNDELDRQDVQHFSAAGASLGIFNFAGPGTNGAATALADGRSVFVMENFTTSEISLEFLDTRDAVNATPVNSTNLQVGTNDGDTFTVNSSTGAAYGGAGNDFITSDGTTSIYGGVGDDTIFAANGLPEVLDGGVGTDTLDTTSASIFFYQINLTTGVTNFGGESFVNFENLVAGNGGNSIVGTSGDNNITGGTGNDVIYGSTVGVSDGGFDTINSGDGADTVYSSGNGLFNLGNGNDTFVAHATGITETANGGAGVDTLDISVGNFTYTMNLVTGVSNFGESYTNFENVTSGGGDDTLIGTTGDNIMNGAAGTDYLVGQAGNDTLNGGTGVNTLQGGTGNDIYLIFANRTDSTLEFVGEGTDEVRTTFSIYGLQNHIENLTAADNGVHGALVGNTLANTITGGTGRDDIFGRDGDDSIYGGTGTANALYGQLGNDIYYVQAAGDSVRENVGEGTDTVRASVGSFTLGNNVENLTYTGAAAFVGVGNGLGNTIRGGALADSLNGMGGNDVIFGASGADIIQGGTGADQFRYEGGETGMDRILDFVSGTDDIALRSAFFTPTATVSFASGVGAVATTANSTIIYHTNTGIVYYDDDGNGAGVAVALAQLNGGQAFTASDFLFY